MCCLINSGLSWFSQYAVIRNPSPTSPRRAWFCDGHTLDFTPFVVGTQAGALFPGGPEHGRALIALDNAGLESSVCLAIGFAYRPMAERR